VDEAYALGTHFSGLLWPRQARQAARPQGPRPSESAGLRELFSSAVSQRKPVTTVRADCEFAIAFRVPPPPPPPPRRLERRCGGRHFFQGRRIDRSGTRIRSTSNRKPSRQAEKEEYGAHEYLPGSPRRQRRRFPSVPSVAVRCASNPVGVVRKTHPAAPTSTVIARGPKPRQVRQPHALRTSNTLSSRVSMWLVTIPWPTLRLLGWPHPLRYLRHF
jgi:hypothetical protein